MATIKSILETYVPRTEGMAARADSRGEPGTVVKLQREGDV